MMSEIDYVKNSQKSSNLVDIGLHLSKGANEFSVRGSCLHGSTTGPKQEEMPMIGKGYAKLFSSNHASKISPKSNVWQNKQLHVFSPVPHTPSDAPTAPATSESTPAEECERAKFNQLEIVQERLLLLINFHGPSGILSSDLPGVYHQTYKERLDMLDEGEEKCKLADLLSHPCITAVMNKGGQLRYVYNKSGQAAKAPILPAFPQCIPGDNCIIESLRFQSKSRHNGSCPAASPTPREKEPGLGPLRVQSPPNLATMNNFSCTLLDVNSSCISSTSTSNQTLSTTFGSSPSTPTPTLPIFISAINSTLSPSPLIVPTSGPANVTSMNAVAGGLILNSSHMPLNGASNTSFFGTPENISASFHQPDSVYFDGLEPENTLSINLPKTALSLVSAANIGCIHDTQNSFMAQKSIITGSSLTLGSSGITDNGSLIRGFDFESNGSPFQRRPIDFGSFMGGLLTTPSPFINGSQQASAAISSPVLDFTDECAASNTSPPDDFVNSMGLSAVDHGADRINSGAMNGTGGGNIASGASAAPGPVGGTRRRGPSISNPGSTGSIGSLTLDVSAALDNAFGSGSPNNKPATITGLGALQMVSGGGMTGSGLLLSESDNISATDLSEHRHAQVCANNQLLQSQVLSLQNDLIGKSRELDMQGQHMMEAMHLLQKSEDRFLAVNAEKEKTLTQWRHKTNELIESESKLRMKNDELCSIREVLKDRESALSRSELTKNSLIPELKQLRNRISQMESELEEARKRTSEFERIKNSLTQEIESLRDNQNCNKKSQSSPCSDSASSNSNSLSQSPCAKTPQPIDLTPIYSSQAQISSSPSMSLYEFKPSGPGPITVVSSAGPTQTAFPGSANAIAWDNDRARVALQAEVDSLRSQLNDLRRSMGSFQEYFPAANANSSASRPNASVRIFVPPSALPATKTVTVAHTSSANSSYAQGDANGSGSHQTEESYKPIIKCSLSGCEQNGLHICTGCNLVGYCRLEHQKEHWKIHGKFCAGKK